MPIVLQQFMGIGDRDDPGTVQELLVRAQQINRQRRVWPGFVGCYLKQGDCNQVWLLACFSLSHQQQGARQ